LSTLASSEIETPEEFVEAVLDAAVDAGRVTDERVLEGYRLRAPCVILEV